MVGVDVLEQQLEVLLVVADQLDLGLILQEGQSMQETFVAVFSTCLVDFYEFAVDGLGFQSQHSLVSMILMKLSVVVEL